MANDERRGGGYGPPGRPDGRPGAGEATDSPIEATRALDVADLALPAGPADRSGSGERSGNTVRAAVPAAPRPAPRPPGSVAAAPRPVPRPAPPPSSASDGEGEGATQMLNTADLEARLAAIQAAQQPGKPIELRIVAGPDRGKSHDVLPGESLVGRGLDCQIVLADPAVSRKHFKIVRTGDNATLVDLGGANGTLVNGQKVPQKPLEPGDRIDVGTSTLEVVIDGHASRQRPAPAPMRPVTEESGPLHQPSAPAPQSGGRPKWLIPVVVAVLVLLAGGVAAWVFLGDNQPAETEPGAETGEAGGTDEAAALKKLLAEAQTLIDDGEYEEAKDLLRKPRKANPDNQELQALYKKARSEAANQEKLDEAKGSLEDKDFAGAFEKLASIPKDSDLYDDAEEELTSAKAKYADDQLREASAVMATDSAKAMAILDELLKLVPDNAAAKALRLQLAAPGDSVAEGGAPGAEAGAAASAGTAAGADAGSGSGSGPGSGSGSGSAPGSGSGSTAGAKPAPAVAPTPAAAAKPAAAAPAPAPAVAVKRADFSAGFAAYKGRQWSASLQAFAAIAEGPYAKADKVKATSLISAVKAVEGAMADAQGATGVAAAKAWRRAYDNDKSVDGSHAAFLIKKTATAWVDAARKAKAESKFDDAMTFAQESQNYEDVAEAGQIIAFCKQKATELLTQAKDNMKKGNYSSAGEQARKVVKILGAGDPKGVEATQIAKEAAEKARGED